MKNFRSVGIRSVKRRTGCLISFFLLATFMDSIDHVIRKWLLVLGLIGSLTNLGIARLAQTLLSTNNFSLIDRKLMRYPYGILKLIHINQIDCRISIRHLQLALSIECAALETAKKSSSQVKKRESAMR